MKTPGLYVHIPFCRSKCPYCAFFSIASTSLVPRWLDAFKKEVSCYKDRFNCFDSLYLGGGTPTVLGSEALASVMDVLFTHFTFESDPEITIEANPCDLTQEKIRELKDAGFNRFSLGVQSFDDRMLSFLGRRHTVLQAEQAIEKLQSSGVENISIDLIYGFEGQQINEWMKTLRRALSFRPEHLSCYQLTVEKKTHFGRLRDRGLLRPLSEKEESDIFLATSQFLVDNGYIHYEISSFARKKIYYSRHNSKYWQHAPYLGLGPSAHSFDGSRRWWNVRSVRKYCDVLENGRAPVEDSECLTDEQLRFESIMLGLRTADGLNQDAIIDNHQSGRMLHGLQDAGFLRVENGRVVPTRKGFLVADYLASCLGG
jgi:oxygen-independent coproporphyrinogen-3 oxidase